jgi:hypothetical protein
MALTTINPTANQTPDAGQGGVAVTGATNTGHSSTTASVIFTGSQLKTCRWSSFPSFSGQILSINLKVSWTEDGTLEDGGVDTDNFFTIEYSINGGSNWIIIRSSSNIQSANNGTESVVLSIGQDLTQVQVRDSLQATSGVEGLDASVTVSISDIKIEISTVDANPIFLG